MGAHPRARLRLFSAAICLAAVALSVAPSPNWEGAGANAKPRSNSELSAKHVPTFNSAIQEECHRIQHLTYTNSWNALSEVDKAEWKIKVSYRPGRAAPAAAAVPSTYPVLLCKH